MNIIESRKIGDSSIEITKEVPQIEMETKVYDRDFIEQQIVQIQKQKDEDNTKRDLELEECYQILDEMNKCDIISKVDNIVK